MELRDALVEYSTRTESGTIYRSNKTMVPADNRAFGLLPALAAAEEYRLTRGGTTVDNVTVELSFPVPGEGNYILKYSTAMTA